MKFGDFLSTLGFDMNKEIPNEISTVEQITNTANELNTIAGNEPPVDTSSEMEQLRQDLKVAQDQLVELKAVNAAIIARTPVDSTGEDKTVEDMIYNLCARRA